MKSPLRNRHLRDLRGDLGKYLTIFLLLVLSIAECSGFLVADESMLYAYEESFEKYRIEDGHFICEKPLSARQERAIREAGAQTFDLFYTDRPLESGSTLRIFGPRKEVDRVCVMEGALPAQADEIAIDRMYADNNGLHVGDVITVAEPKMTFRISGLVALSDYSALFQDNSDTMFDAMRFGAGVISEEAFAGFDRDLLTFCYAWTYDVPPADESAEDDASADFLAALGGIVSLTDYVPRYQNQAICFTGDDLGQDRAMIMVLLYALIVILSFVFAITISNTITREANVIGTLRATGYTRGELLRHYLTMPVLVTFAAAVVGNILGYTVMKDINARLYYNSYSLPTYVTRWNVSAFWKTTVIPLVLMILINVLILHIRLKLPVLSFLRRDLRRSGKRGAMPLPARIPFFSRFRLRIVLQNLNSYLMLFVGILFANFLLLFGLMFPAVLDNYMEALPNNMFCNYQYMLQLPANAVREDRKLESLAQMLLFREAVETDNPDAEPFSAYVLRTVPTEGYKEEEITLYGLAPDSRYLSLSFSGEEVCISRAYAEKWDLSPGDVITLTEPYDNASYDFRVAQIHPYDGALCVFMDQEVLNARFDLGEGTFTGYFSDTEITDIDKKYLGTVVDYESLSRISRQLQHSMGDLMSVVAVFAVIMFVILVYLLTKIIIEKNAASISMAKILGYTDREIGGLYIFVTTILVLAFLVLSIPLNVGLLARIFRILLQSKLSGWIPFLLSRSVYVRMLIYGVATYAVVALLEYRKITRVPMDEALKNVE